MAAEPDKFLPLSPAAQHILLALAGEDLHGYGIMLETSRQSACQYKLGPGTLYDNLKKLMDAGIVEESKRQSANGDPRRRYYRLTGFGRCVLEAEVKRLERVIREAKAALLGARPRRT